MKNGIVVSAKEWKPVMAVIQAAKKWSDERDRYHHDPAVTCLDLGIASEALDKALDKLCPHSVNTGRLCWCGFFHPRKGENIKPEIADKVTEG